MFTWTWGIRHHDDLGRPFLDRHHLQGHSVLDQQTFEVRHAQPVLLGAHRRLGDFAGKTVFANLWATWCGPCRKKLPLIQGLHERLRSDARRPP